MGMGLGLQAVLGRCSPWSHVSSICVAKFNKTKEQGATVLFRGWEIKLRALHLLGQRCTSDLNLQPPCRAFLRARPCRVVHTCNLSTQGAGRLRITKYKGSLNELHSENQSQRKK